MGEIGIDLRVNAQTDGIRQAGQDIDEFTKKISSALGINDPEKIEQYWQEYNSGLEKATQLADKLSLIEKRKGGSEAPDQGGEGGGGEGQGGRGGGESDRQASNLTQGIFKLERMLRSSVGGASRDAGSTLVGLAENGASGLTNAISGAGGAAAAVAVGAAIVVAVGAITNELSKQYEQVVPTLMSVTASLNRFGETARAQSDIFRDTMTEISQKASRFGYTFQQGAAVVEQLARAGTRDAMAGAESVMAFAKGYGFQNIPTEIAQVYGQASRYGLNGQSALNLVAGGANATVGAGRIQDYMAGTLSIFEEGVSEGIIKGFDRITAAQNWIYSQFGEIGAGRQGAELYSRMSGGVRGATGLQSETDLLLYRAARRMGPAGESYVDTMSRLEGGFDPELYRQFKASISGASRTEQIELIRQAFGLNYTQAIELYNGNREMTAITGAAPGREIVNTAESQLIGHQEQIANTIRELGTTALDIKEVALRGFSAVIGALLGNRIDRRTAREAAAAEAQTWVDAPDAMKNASIAVYARQGNPSQFGVAEPWMISLQEMIDSPSTRDFWNRITPEQKQNLAALNYRDREEWSNDELMALYQALMTLQQSLDRNTGATNGNTQAQSAPSTVTVPATGNGSQPSRRGSGWGTAQP